MMPAQNLIADIVDDKFNPFYSTFKSWWINEIVMGFRDDYPELYLLTEELIKPKMLAENRYYNETKTYKFPDGEIYKVSKGMRPMRIITKIAQKYDCDAQMLENFRLWHSRMLNQKYMDGELCLSIHPLDFMTMSDNDNNWESCMKWIDVGEYRCGTVECMNSPVVLVAYLHSPAHIMKRPSCLLSKDWEWNSKKWRELFIIEDGIISEVKGYCFQDETLTNTVLMWIKELAQKNLGWEYDNDEINIQDTIPWENDTDMCFHFSSGQYMYNDIGTLEIHRARINRQKLGKYDLTEWMTKDNKQHYMAEIYFGGQATCMWCGQDINEQGRENAVMCSDCDSGKFCVYCGALIRGEDYGYVDDIEGPLCLTCYYEECGDDDLSGARYLIDDLTPIYWVVDFDENNEPIRGVDDCSVFYHFYGYLPNMDNCYYSKIFKNNPKLYKDNWTIYHYITLDDVIDLEAFLDLFNLAELPDNVVK